MTTQLQREELQTLARILPAIEIAPPRIVPVEVKRSFDMPPVLHVGVCAVFLAYLAILGVGLATPGLIIPMAIFAIFTIAMFAVPALWVRMKPINAEAPMGWARFRREGVMTHTGHASAGAVMGQMFVVPLVVLGWGIAIVTVWGLTA